MGRRGCFGINGSAKLESLSSGDGTSNTFMVGEYARSKRRWEGMQTSWNQARAWAYGRTEYATGAFNWPDWHDDIATAAKNMWMTCRPNGPSMHDGLAYRTLDTNMPDAYQYQHGWAYSSLHGQGAQFCL